MSKELKALEDIILYLNANEPKGLYVENIIIIKSALKRLQEIDTNTIPNMKERYNECNIERIIVRNERAKLYKENEKLKRVLEIIKEKKVNVDILLDYIQRDNKLSLGALKTYNLEVDKSKHLTQEEFNLLKEVLL